MTTRPLAPWREPACRFDPHLSRAILIIAPTHRQSVGGSQPRSIIAHVTVLALHSPGKISGRNISRNTRSQKCLFDPRTARIASNVNKSSTVISSTFLSLPYLWSNEKNL
jgi:hypothetical protein